MKPVSTKRARWLRDYIKILKCWFPDKCARCGRPGAGWVNFGGDFEPHHPFKRLTHWQCCIAIPFCSDCHRWTHDHATQARKDGWLIEPKTIDHLNPPTE